MTKTFNSDSIIQVDDMIVVVDTELPLQLGSIIISGNTALKQGWNWGIHTIEAQKDLDHYLYMRNFMKEQRQRTPTLSSLFTEPIIATLHKRLEGVPLIELPDSLKIESDEIGDSYAGNNCSIDDPQNEEEIEMFNEIKDHYASGYYDGYKEAQSKRTYTEADMKKAIEWGRDIRNEEGDIPDFLQSLKPKNLPTSITLEYEEYTPYISHETSEDTTTYFTLKITDPDTNTIHPKEVKYG